MFFKQFNIQLSILNKNKNKKPAQYIAQVKGFYVHLRKGINEHMWGFIKTVNKLLTVVWAFLSKIIV